VKEDVPFEALPVAVAEGPLDQALDAIVQTLDWPVGQPGLEVGEDVRQMLAAHPRRALDWFEPAANRPAIPALEMAAGPAAAAFPAEVFGLGIAAAGWGIGGRVPGALGGPLAALAAGGIGVVAEVVSGVFSRLGNMLGHQGDPLQGVGRSPSPETTPHPHAACEPKPPT
jgi:hypothetical protein